MRNPSIAELDQWLESSKGLLKKVALAPERDEVTEFINYAHKKNVFVALGHSDATYDQAANAVEAGASIWFMLIMVCVDLIIVNLVWLVQFMNFQILMQS